MQAFQLVVLLSVFVRCCVCNGTLSLFGEYHREHLPVQLSLNQSQEDGNLLLPFNTTRVSGSSEALGIQQFILDHFTTGLQNNWTVEQDNFQENGYNFTNLVFTLDTARSDVNKNGTKYILFAAHYDTLVNPAGFVGAVDSAASCAILMYLAQFLDTLAYEDRQLLQQTILGGEYGVKIVFFDGEEAIEEWTATDSIYGSRHLAAQWLEDGTMEQIELFVLLDLLGGATTKQVPRWKIKSYYKEAHRHYQQLSKIEDAYLADPATPFSKKELFPSDVLYMMMGRVLIEDDHVPFYNASVPILHLIPFPFPETWHTINDTFDTLDEAEIQRWAVLLSEFAVDTMAGPQ